MLGLVAFKGIPKLNIYFWLKTTNDILGLMAFTNIKFKFLKYGFKQKKNYSENKAPGSFQSPPWVHMKVRRGSIENA